MPSYEVHASSSAPPERLFALVADGERWSQWAGPFVPRSSWEREGDPPPGGVGAIRRVGLGIVSREEVTAYDPPHRMAYRIVSGVPVRDYTAEVVLTPTATGTDVVWRGSFQPVVPGSGPMLAAMLRGVVGGFARRLARAAERA